jgi:Protein of unknown function (DUF3800)
MQLVYMDESGTGLGDKQTPYFILAAVVIPIDQWQGIDSQVTALKRRLVSWAKPEDFEIKGRDMRRGEKFFKSLNWSERVKAIGETALLITTLPCQIFAVQVDKRDLPTYIGSEADLYRLAFWRLLDELDTILTRLNQPGMLMADMRSDLHSSVQDRRLVDAYREWIGSRMGQTRMVELPWFGFSAFYAGLQLADFAAYMLDWMSNEEAQTERNREISGALQSLRKKVQLVQIP